MSSPSNALISKNVLQLFKSSLWELQQEIQHAIESAEKEIRAFANSGPMDDVDASCVNSAKEAMFARLSQARMQLRKVKLALERVRNGNFGVCASCDGSIELKRLQAVPWAVNCLECQQRAEQGGQMESATMQPSFAG